jgi:hypothetical protein
MKVLDEFVNSSFVERPSFNEILKRRGQLMMLILMVNRHIAKNGFWKKRRKSYYAILPNFFQKNQHLVQNAEFFFCI